MIIDPVESVSVVVQKWYKYVSRREIVYVGGGNIDYVVVECI